MDIAPLAEVIMLLSAETLTAFSASDPCTLRLPHAFGPLSASVPAAPQAPPGLCSPVALVYPL
jgi:hypothetical protein